MALTLSLFINTLTVPSYKIKMGLVTVKDNYLAIIE